MSTKSIYIPVDDEQPEGTENADFSGVEIRYGKGLLYILKKDETTGKYVGTVSKVLEDFEAPSFDMERATERLRRHYFTLQAEQKMRLVPREA